MKQASINVKMKSVFYLNRVKLKINAKKKFGKLIVGSWTTFYSLLIKKDKEEITRETIQYFEMNYKNYNIS